MKSIISVSYLVSLILLLQGCATQPIFYHSEASLPFYHNSTKTVFHLIQDHNAKNTFEFGIITAIDNDTLSYVVLAPSIDGRNVNELTDVNLNYSIPLLPEQAKEFIKILDSSADMWGTKYDAKDGISYEFMIAPQNKIIQQSESVVMWYSTFRYYFQNNDDGPLASILFGDGLLQYYYRVERLSAIKDLSSMLSLAIKK